MVERRARSLVKQPAKQNPVGATGGVLCSGTVQGNSRAMKNVSACHLKALLSARSPTLKKGPRFLLAGPSRGEAKPLRVRRLIGTIVSVPPRPRRTAYQRAYRRRQAQGRACVVVELDGDDIETLIEARTLDAKQDFHSREALAQARGGISSSPSSPHARGGPCRSPGGFEPEV